MASKQSNFEHNERNVSLNILNIIGLEDKTAIPSIPIILTPEVASVVKRACEMIAQRGGFVRSMENIGHRQLPYKMSSHGDRHTTGQYVLLNFDSPPRILDDLQDELHRDIDIIRPSVLKKEEPFERPCLIAPCVFGELPFPDHEKRTWRAKVHKQLGSSYKTVETRKKHSFEKTLL